MKKKRRVVSCGKCRSPMIRSKERISLFHGAICRSCARVVPLIDSLAVGLAKLLERH